MKKIFFAFLSVLAAFNAIADEYRIDAVYPGHWWVGMKNPRVQLVVRGANVQENRFTLNYPGVQLVKVTKPENRNYVFIDLLISAAAKPGTARIKIINPDGTGELPFVIYG